MAEAPVVKGVRGEADEAVSDILDVERWPGLLPSSRAPVGVPEPVLLGG